ncbi:hypothetical protein MW887_002616 [Aspergillus wentii]|nr:hypothetical protein MW887_002616 [Aspergillus wentii]
MAPQSLYATAKTRHMQTWQKENAGLCTEYHDGIELKPLDDLEHDQAVSEQADILRYTDQFIVKIRGYMHRRFSAKMSSYSNIKYTGQMSGQNLELEKLCILWSF